MGMRGNQSLLGQTPIPMLPLLRPSFETLWRLGARKTDLTSVEHAVRVPVW